MISAELVETDDFAAISRLDPTTGGQMSLLGKLREELLAVEQPADPWLAPLQRVRGKVEFDGLERVSSQTLLDILEVPQRSRTAGAYRRLAKLMAQLGWTALRVRDLTRGGYKEQIRGYVRQVSEDRKK
jgi:hypothetical protein